MDSRRVRSVWGRILMGHAPLLSIEITRECPLRCPGCYAYGDEHLGGELTLRELSDLRGDDLVRGVVDTVRRHRPLQVSLVGGEPLVRHRELSRILPEISRMGVHTLVVTSAVIRIPKEWMEIPLVRVAVSIDGLRQDHDVRRAPATYDRILKNIEGCRVDISWVITHQQMNRPGYLDEYLAFWSSRPEVDRIWLSTYTPQVNEISEETLTPEDQRELIRVAGIEAQVSGPHPDQRDGRGDQYAPSQSRRVYVFQNVGELFRRSQDPDRALLLRWQSRLHEVRLRHQHQLALDRKEETAWPGNRQSRREEFDCGRLAGEPAPPRRAPRTTTEPYPADHSLGEASFA